MILLFFTNYVVDSTNFLSKFVGFFAISLASSGSSLVKKPYLITASGYCCINARISLRLKASYATAKCGGIGSGSGIKSGAATLLKKFLNA